MITITVPLVPPSPNVLKRKYRDPHAYKALRDQWEHDLAFGVSSSREKLELMTQARRGKVRLDITVHHPGVYDPDNLVGSLKPVLDALRNVGYIFNDTPMWMEFHVEQIKTTRQKTVIKISPVS